MTIYLKQIIKNQFPSFFCFEINIIKDLRRRTSNADHKFLNPKKLVCTLTFPAYHFYPLIYISLNPAEHILLSLVTIIYYWLVKKSLAY